MNIIMLDFEGMNNYGPKTRIIQMSAIEIDLKTGDIHREFNYYVKDKPLWTVDSNSTKEFWRNQPIWPEMKRRMESLGVSHKLAMVEFHKWYHAKPPQLVYTCGAYDVSIMESYEYNLALSNPVPFWMYRDFRGIREQYKELLKNDWVEWSGNHFSDEDVKAQGHALHHCYKHYGYRPKYSLENLP